MYNPKPILILMSSSPMHLHVCILLSLSLSGLEQGYSKAKQKATSKEGEWEMGVGSCSLGLGVAVQKWEEEKGRHAPFVSKFYDPDIMSVTKTTACQTMLWHFKKQKTHHTVTPTGSMVKKTHGNSIIKPENMEKTWRIAPTQFRVPPTVSSSHLRSNSHIWSLILKQ